MVGGFHSGNDSIKQLDVWLSGGWTQVFGAMPVEMDGRKSLAMYNTLMNWRAIRVNWN